MTSWKKHWIWILVLGCLFHGVRDISQFLGADWWLATFLHKDNSSEFWLWHPLNTVVIEIVLFSTALWIWKRGHFGLLGWGSILVVVVTTALFAVYWVSF